MSIINDLPPAPSRSDPATFSDKADALLGALDGFVSETNVVVGEVLANKTLAETAASTATTQASNASTSASTASTQASNASSSASSASTSASTATTQAGIATAAASTATTQAGIATAAAASINLASPAAIGNVTPNSGAFTTLSATGTTTLTSTSADQLFMTGGTTVESRVRLSRGTDEPGQSLHLGWNSIILERTGVAPASVGSLDIKIRGTSDVTPVSISSAGVAVNGDTSATGVLSTATRLRFTANGYSNVDATVSKSATYGLILQGAVGSSYDFGLTSAGGSLDVIRVPTGTNTVQLVGAASVGSTTEATNLGVGSLVTQGGLSVAKRIWTGGSQFNTTAATDFEMVHRGAGGWDFYTDTASKIPFRIHRLAPTNTLQVTATGLAVTGVLSSTGKITQSGTAGFEINDGSMLGKFSYAGGLQIDRAAGTSLLFAANGSTQAVFDASGNFGLGVTPSAWGANFKAMQFNGLYGGALSTSSASNTSTNVSHCAYHNGTNWIYGATGFGAARYEIDGPSGGATHKWFTAPSGTAGNSITFTQAMTLDANGDWLLGKTGTGVASTGVVIFKTGALQSTVAGTGFNYHAIYANNSGTEVGSITSTGSTTTYATSSDYRLKNITGPITDSGAYIDSLNPVQGTWKADGSTFVGLIAHEVQEASRTPVATGTKDGAEMQAMDYSSSEIIANLIAELQSLRARVAQLEGI